ncbi:NAD(P)/FAD-dependent oxidoreductase [Pseudomonas sp. R2.Fl]|nr:NAD(P)/FAD-dependent oxidoreductase [Pseudomonas sp. R2.Fl]
MATDFDRDGERDGGVVIVGAGFGGLACARALGNTDVPVTVIDRRNHNLFQPLLYQVATAALSPADISEPIRRTLGRFRNIKVVMAEVTGIDTDAHRVLLRGTEPVPYRRLVIATGSEYNYFGHDEWRRFAPGMKTIHEARIIRQRLLLAYEKAERISDPEEKKRLLTTVIIGGGPTGVELAGAVSELGRSMIARDFRFLSHDDIRVVLIEAGPRMLAAFPEELSRYAETYLENIGVNVRVGSAVGEVRDGAVRVGEEEIGAGCIVWAAGIKASPVARWLGVEAGPGGRVPVDGHLALKGVEDVYVIGDAALALDAERKPLPALAQVAKQQGEYLGSLLREPRPEGAMKPFVFRNRGNTAVVGRNAAIFDFGSWTMKGFLAWLLWAIVHVYLLVNFEKRVLVSIQWIWRYITHQRGARLIDEDLST